MNTCGKVLLSILAFVAVTMAQEQQLKYPLIGHVSWVSLKDTLRYDRNTYTVTDEYGSTHCTFAGNTADCSRGAAQPLKWPELFDMSGDAGSKGTPMARLEGGREVTYTDGRVSTNNFGLLCYPYTYPNCAPDPLGKLLAAAPKLHESSNPIAVQRAWALTDSAMFRYRLVKEWSPATINRGEVIVPAQDAICVPYSYADKNGEQKWAEECYLVNDLFDETKPLKPPY